MKKFINTNIATYVLIALTLFIAYYLLLDNLHTSINSFMDTTYKIVGTSYTLPHILVLTFLPIYIAIMIFGASLLGSHLGSKLQRKLETFFKDK